MGRLTEVVENPGVLNYTTTYTYDALNNLLTSTQGSQTRTFVYDSLSRLASAVNPESGTVSYRYDANGNLIGKTDARGVITTMSYDGVNRMRSKTYSDSTPPVYYCYDGLTTGTNCGGAPTGAANLNLKGHLTMVYTSASQTRYTAFSDFGEITASQQLTGGTTYGFPSYSYNKLSQITSMTYPSGRVVKTEYDSAGRATCVWGGAPSTCPASTSAYASNASYAPHGGISGLTFGSNLAETTTFNRRLQPTNIQAGSLLSLAYTYGTSGNNGNVLTQTITRGGQTWTQTYDAGCYDNVNRLACATETGPGTGWSQTYGYDQFGNRWVTGSTQSSETPLTQSWYNAANNRYTVASGWTYDTAGNILHVGGMTRDFTYDAENRQKTAIVNGTTTTYTYDGDGRRVQKTVGAATTVFVYDAAGTLAAEYGASTDTGTKYITADHLGSTRLETDSAGAVAKCYDYFPFGEELGNGVNARGSCFGSSAYPASPDKISNKFTSKERDAESGLDYFEARYFSGAQGRFTSADVPLADQWEKDPQSWNLYSYARNNPLRFTDPTGRACVNSKSGWIDDNNGGQSCADVEAENKQVKPSATATGQAGNVATAVVLNAFFALSNYSNDFFRPLTNAMGVQPSYMQNVPVSDGATGRLADGVVFVGTTVLGPGGAKAPLKLIHSAETLSKTILGHLRTKTTQELVDSLKPGVVEALRVKPDGRVMNGNHRVTVLMERGVDVNALPREIVK